MAFAIGKAIALPLICFHNPLCVAELDADPNDQQADQSIPQE